MRRSGVLALIPLLLLGCGGGLAIHPTAPVTGKVVCEGQPVPNVIVNFAPQGKGEEAGKMGVGIAKADGTFVVTTYSDGDGAVIGKHKVSVSPPHPEDFPNFSCKCETLGNRFPVQDVEITSEGKKELVVELPVKFNGGMKSRRTQSPDVDEPDATKR